MTLAGVARLLRSEKPTEAPYSAVAMTPDLTDEEAALIAGAKELGDEIKTLLPQLVAARKNWLRSRNESDAQTLDTIQAQADTLAARHASVVKEMQRISGVPEEVFEEIERARIRGDADSRLFRSDLTVNKVASTADIDAFLPTALEEMLRLVDPRWLRADESEQHRLSKITTGQPLSLVRGLRPRSEVLEIHRFLQALRVAHDYLNGHPAYDHFAGATRSGLTRYGGGRVLALTRSHMNCSSPQHALREAARSSS
jgi:hypothetical protein